MDHFDVIIVGAGLSGIGAAVHLQKDCPGRSYVILEGREAIGGTWDLFRYPGIRSDSDMYTLGYKFKPWTAAKAIADGPSILSYVREAAAEHGVERHIRFDHKITAASWDSAAACWTVTAARGDGGDATFSCNFLYMCTGYYSYAEGHRPEFPGEAEFKGQLVHPQFWPETLDYAGKRVVVIGSGATAVTLVPEMAKDAAHVTMLQRSPTYVVTRPAKDAAADWLRDHLPAKLAYSLVRFKNVTLGMWFYNTARKQPAKVKAKLIEMAQAELGPDYDVATHFTPSYNPWDQRLCLVPDSDLFAALKAGSASVVTDGIERFTAAGIQLASGAELPADIIVTATGPEADRARRDAADGRRRRGRSGAVPRLQGHDVLERAQSRGVVRLHQRVVDAALGPHRDVCRAAAQPDGGGRLRHRDAAAVGGCGAAEFGDVGIVVGLCPARRDGAAQAGHALAVEGDVELCARHDRAAVRQARRRRDGVHARRAGGEGRGGGRARARRGLVRSRVVMPNLFRHPRRGKPTAAVLVPPWMLKQVQHDERKK